MIANVKDLIQLLQTTLDPEELIVATWWTKEDVDLVDNDTVLDDSELETVWHMVADDLDDYLDGPVSEMNDRLFDLVNRELAP